MKLRAWQVPSYKFSLAQLVSSSVALLTELVFIIIPFNQTVPAVSSIVTSEDSEEILESRTLSPEPRIPPPEPTRTYNLQRTSPHGKPEFQHYQNERNVIFERGGGLVVIKI